MYILSSFPLENTSMSLAIPFLILISPLILSNSPVFRGVIKSIMPLIETPVIPPVIKFAAYKRYSNDPSFGILPSITLK